MSGARVSQTVRSAPSASDADCVDSCARDAPEAAVSDAAVRRIQRQEQIPAGRPRTRPENVFQDGFAHLMLQWVCLHTSALGVIHHERLRLPVEVTQLEARYLPAA